MYICSFQLARGSLQGPRSSHGVKQHVNMQRLCHPAKAKEETAAAATSLIPVCIMAGSTCRRASTKTTQMHAVVFTARESASDMQGVHHKAEVEEGSVPGCGSQPHPDCLAAPPGQEVRPAAHPQDAASQRHQIPAAAGQPGQVGLAGFLGSCCLFCGCSMLCEEESWTGPACVIV